MIATNSIGGYFELELPNGKEYHLNAIRLNTGRNAFEYILKSKDYKKVYLPFYTCDVMLEPIQKLNIKVEYYSIDETFRPIFDFSIVSNQDVFVYTNYFGICDKQVFEVSQKCNNLIIDNAQAFYSSPIKGVDTFYSPRKFFGISDGAYLYTDKELVEVLETDESYRRFSHLLKRMDSSAEMGYADFVSNDKSLDNNPIRKMSNLTSRLLTSINYDEISIKRKENFNFLHAVLSQSNKLKFDINTIEVPMVYPYWATKELREKLLEHKVYTAKYWSNVSEWVNNDCLEMKLTEEVIHLPIDQRQTKVELDKIIKIIFHEYSR